MGRIKNHEVRLQAIEKIMSKVDVAEFKAKFEAEVKRIIKSQQPSTSPPKQEKQSKEVKSSGNKN